MHAFIAVTVELASCIACNLQDISVTTTLALTLYTRLDSLNKTVEPGSPGQRLDRCPTPKIERGHLLVLPIVKSINLLYNGRFEVGMTPDGVRRDPG